MMRLSRLRLRLAAGFALAFALGLGILAAGALGYLWRESNKRLNARLASVAEGVASALARELHETPDSTFAYAANQVVEEWPANEDAFAITDEQHLLVAGVDRGHALDRILGAWPREGFRERYTVVRGGPEYRAVTIPKAVYHEAGHEWRFAVIAFASTEGIESDTEMLGGAFAVAAPLIVLLSLAAGYALARRALHPVVELGASIAAIAPADLSRRLPAGRTNDEIDALATEFNGLLQRLDEAQRRNRGFVREAAHQIRTPLTLVLGEAGHELATTESSGDRMRGTLQRIRVAAEQMQRRVDELFLLAEAQAGEPVRLDDDVELDGLALDCTDLMRERSSSLGRSLAIERAEPLVVRGNQALLQEALVELIENGCRHGTPDAPVTVSVFGADGEAVIEVASAGAPFTLPAAAPKETPGGLGLPIVEWIAQAHGGTLGLTRTGDRNRLALRLPVRADTPAATGSPSGRSALGAAPGLSS